MLPIELYGLIAEHVDVQLDLFALLRASQRMLAGVERVLYRNIHLTKYRSSSFNELLDTLLSNPRRASLVHHLRLHFAYGFGPEQESIARLSSALPRLTNLIRLELKSISLNLADLPSGCTLRLERFGYYVDKITDPSLPVFLHSQPHLLYLSLPNYIGEFDVQKCCGGLLKLKTLECLGDLANKLLPDRHVERLSLWNWSPSPKYTGCYPSLRVLKLQTGLNSLDGQAFCPNLRFLELFINSNNSLLRDTAEKLKGFRRLHTLRVTVTWQPKDRHGFVDQLEDEAARELFSSIETLQLVQINAKEWRRANTKGLRVREGLSDQRAWDEWEEG